MLLFILSLKHIQGLEAVAGDGDDGKIAGSNAALGIEAGGDRGGDAACGFSKYAFGFGQFLDRGNDLHVGNIFRPAAASADGADGVRAICGIADCERAGDGVRPLRLGCAKAIFTAWEMGSSPSPGASKTAHWLV